MIRRWYEGVPTEEWIRAQLNSGSLSQRNLELAAHFQNHAARIVLGLEAVTEPRVESEILRRRMRAGFLQAKDVEVLAHFRVPAARRFLGEHPTVRPEHSETIFAWGQRLCELDPSLISPTRDSILRELAEGGTSEVLLLRNLRRLDPNVTAIHAASLPLLTCHMDGYADPTPWLENIRFMVAPGVLGFVPPVVQTTTWQKLLATMRDLFFPGDSPWS